MSLVTANNAVLAAVAVRVVVHVVLPLKSLVCAPLLHAVTPASMGSGFGRTDLMRPQLIPSPPAANLRTDQTGLDTSAVIGNDADSSDTTEDGTHAGHTRICVSTPPLMHTHARACLLHLT